MKTFNFWMSYLNINILFNYLVYIIIYDCFCVSLLKIENNNNKNAKK